MGNEIFAVILFPEMIVSLILLEQEVDQFLITMDWIRVFDCILKAVDKLNKLIPDIEIYDADDISWPGVFAPHSAITMQKNHDELPLIKGADVENHNLDGGLWTIINNKVYDVQDFRCDNVSFMETLHKYAGKDATHIFTNIPNSLSLLQSLESCIVGHYCQPEINTSHTPADYMEVSSVLLDTERFLGYLCGLHAHRMSQSLPLQPSEIVSKNWLHAPFLKGGLQVSLFLVSSCVLILS